MLAHLELLVGNLGTMIGKFMMMVHNLRNHPSMGISFRGSGTMRYNPTLINADMASATRCNTAARIRRGVINTNGYST
jgi:hypothetical protein